MARVVPITPTYASEDLGRILALEQRQVEETVMASPRSSLPGVPTRRPNRR
ncbi:MAG TPA: hypothetical protein VGF38_06245 [Ktedonobacterales bacterium]